MNRVSPLGPVPVSSEPSENALATAEHETTLNEDVPSGAPARLSLLDAVQEEDSDSDTEGFAATRSSQQQVLKGIRKPSTNSTVAGNPSVVPLHASESMSSTRPGSPMSFPRLMVGHHKLIFALALLGHLLGAALLGGLYSNSNYPILEPSGKGNMWNYHVVGETLDSLSREWRAVQADESNNMLNSKMSPQPARSVDAGSFEVILSSATSCLSRDNLIEMRALERELFNTTAYQQRYCHLKSATDCRLPTSVLRLFDGTYEHLNVLDGSSNNIFRADPNFNRIGEIVSTAFDANGDSPSANLIAAGQPYLRDVVEYVVDESYEGGQPIAKFCRLAMPMGLPLDGFKTALDRPSQ
jgi:hypothetical protein